MNNDNKFCAFIDILGFKNKMNNFEDALKYYKCFFAEYNAFNEMHDSIINNVSIKKASATVEDMIFSDSIILYSEDWKALLFKVANVMSLLLSNELIFRGGIGYGKYYSDIQPGHTYIVSEGLVQASEIESKISKYPRIVISQSALSQILIHMNSLYDLNNMLIQDEDDLWFLNPFFLNPNILPIQEFVEQQIIKYRDEKYVEKYIWMKELCIYFYEQNHIRISPNKYYSNESIKYHFFYPKTFHI